MRGPPAARRPNGSRRSRTGRPNRSRTLLPHTPLVICRRCSEPASLSRRGLIMRSSQLQLWKTIAPIFIMLGYLPTVCGDSPVPPTPPPPPLGTCDENSPIDSAVVPKQTGQQGAKGDNGKNNPCAKKKDDPVFFCKSVQDGVLEPTPSCSPRCVTHTRTRKTHMHTRTHTRMQTRHCSPFACHALQMAGWMMRDLEFPRCLTSCTADKLTESCLGTCGNGFCCCASAGNSCVPCDQPCPCPTCSTNATDGACPNDPDGEWALFEFDWTSNLDPQADGTSKKKCCRLVQATRARHRTWTWNAVHTRARVRSFVTACPLAPARIPSRTHTCPSVRGSPTA